MCGSVGFIRLCHNATERGTLTWGVMSGHSADQCWRVSDRFQQFESMSVLVALEVVSSQQAVLELRHVEHDGDPF